MNERPFILNDRFTINPSLGSVNDLLTKKETRIEPRLMNLLCMLAANKDKLVSRAAITKEIWDDYGNADEGLTQAISYLRKVLADDDKTLIETVPKKGYILHAAIAEKGDKTESLDIPTSNRQKYILLAGLLFVLMLAAFIIFRHLQSQKPQNPDVFQPGQKVNSADTMSKGSNPDMLPDTLKNQPADADKKK